MAMCKFKMQGLVEFHFIIEEHALCKFDFEHKSQV
jgi:hypothetical protein